MSDAALEAEVARLRGQVAKLEADRAQPVRVDVEGFEGLRELSHAIETKSLNAFLVDRSVPDRWFWAGVWIPAGLLALIVIIGLCQDAIGVKVL